MSIVVIIFVSSEGRGRKRTGDETGGEEASLVC